MKIKVKKFIEKNNIKMNVVKDSKGRFVKNSIPWNKGLNGYSIHSKEYRNKLKELTGDKAKNWKGGIERRHMLKTLIKDKCSKCSNKTRPLQWHHKDKDVTNNKRDNLVLLCSKCHANLHKNWEVRWSRLRL